MNTLLKIGLSFAWCLTAMLATAIAIEIAFGRPRPGFVPVSTLMLAVPVLFAIWKRPVTQIVRRSAWTSGGIVAVIALVAFLSINWEGASRTVEARNEPEPSRSTAAQVLPSIPTSDPNPYICLITNSQHGERPVLTIEPKEVDEEYAENQLAAVEKYGCREVRITGKVEKIWRDSRGLAYLSLRHGAVTEDVSAPFDGDNELPLRQLKHGQNVTVQCAVDPDRKLRSLHLMNCVLLGSPQLVDGAKRAPDVR